MGAGARTWVTCAAAGLACALVYSVPVQAQEDPAGTTLTLSHRFEREDGQTTARTGLSFGLRRETRSQYLTFQAGGALELAFGNGPADLADPDLRLTYGHESRNTALTTDLRYREVDAQSTALDDDTGVLITDDGRRRDITTSVRLDFGREAPFGGRADLSHLDQSYSGTTDPDFIDAHTSTAGLSLRFDLTPTVSLRTFGDLSDTDRDGTGTDVRRATVGAGLDLTLNQVLSAKLDLSHERVTESGGVPTETREGPGAALTLTRQMQNGTLTGGLSTSITTSGRRTRLDFGRKAELPRGKFDAGLGLVWRDTGSGPDALLRLSWDHEMPRARMRLALSQSLADTSDGDEAINSRLGLSWRQELGREASLTAGMSFRETRYLTGPDPDTSRLGLDLTWRQELRSEIDLVAGYSRSVTRDAGQPDDYSDKIYVGLEKSFQWR